MSIVHFSESNVVKAIIYTTEVREDNECVMPIWIHLIIVHSDIKHSGEATVSLLS